MEGSPKKYGVRDTWNGASFEMSYLQSKSGAEAAQHLLGYTGIHKGFSQVETGKNGSHPPMRLAPQI